VIVKSAIALFCFLIASSATAGSLALTSNAPTVSYAEIVVMPPLSNLNEAMVRSGLRDVSSSVTITCDVLGNVTAVELGAKTGAKALDRAILAWAAKIKMKPGHAGIGSLPIVMSAEG
jgi:hypothetical protein